MKGYTLMRDTITPSIYWTSRHTDFDKEIWYESSPGCCDSMWFPYAEKFMTRFPRLAVRVFWSLIQIRKAWNVFIMNYPSPYPNLIPTIGREKQ